MQKALDVEVRDARVKLLRFIDPQPQRTVGLAWRPTSPRKADFRARGQMLANALRVAKPSQRPRPASTSR